MDIKADKKTLQILTQRRKCIEKYRATLEKRKTAKKTKELKISRKTKTPKEPKAQKEPKTPKSQKNNKTITETYKKCTKSNKK